MNYIYLGKKYNENMGDLYLLGMQNLQLHVFRIVFRVFYKFFEFS